MKTNGRFYIINERNNNIKAAFLTSLPIVWNKDGQFCVIPKAVVANAIDAKKMYDEAGSKVIAPVINIMWSQGIPISNQAGRALVGE